MNTESEYRVVLSYSDEDGELKRGSKLRPKDVASERLARLVELGVVVEVDSDEPPPKDNCHE